MDRCTSSIEGVQQKLSETSLGQRILLPDSPLQYSSHSFFRSEMVFVCICSLQCFDVSPFPLEYTNEKMAIGQLCQPPGSRASVSAALDSGPLLAARSSVPAPLPPTRSCLIAQTLLSLLLTNICLSFLVQPFKACRATSPRSLKLYGCFSSVTEHSGRSLSCQHFAC